MAEHLEAEKSSSILDWLGSVSSNANSQLSSPISHARHPFLCSTSRMTYNFPGHELTLSQAMEACTNGAETPASFRTGRTLQALTGESPSNRFPLRPDKLRFLRLDEWDEYNTYDEEVPTCLHYCIEWKVFVNKKAISRDTEQDLVLAL